MIFLIHRKGGDTKYLQPKYGGDYQEAYEF